MRLKTLLLFSCGRARFLRQDSDCLFVEVRIAQGRTVGDSQAVFRFRFRFGGFDSRFEHPRGILEVSGFRRYPAHDEKRFRTVRCQIDGKQDGERGYRTYEERFLDHGVILSGIVNAATNASSEMKWNGEIGTEAL